MPWCMIGGLAVNHWAAESMATADVELVIATEQIEKATQALQQAGFKEERFEWSINLTGQSKVSIQISTEDFYRDFPSRAIPADIHGILMRVANLEDTLKGKIKAWSERTRHTSKRQKDLTDIARLLETHPELATEISQEILAKLRD